MNYDELFQGAAKTGVKVFEIRASHCNTSQEQDTMWPCLTRDSPNLKHCVINLCNAFYSFLFLGEYLKCCLFTVDCPNFYEFSPIYWSIIVGDMSSSKYGPSKNDY